MGPHLSLASWYLTSPVGKRSPILGFNHNVRYRGLVFHVQTEDSGVASPHLFTHLFHTGVIVSTRKLVYDAGSAEESIKSLMQAQHKAVLKDLRRGHFDDKIDSYLGGTPGLLPRGSNDEGTERATEPTEVGDLGEADLAVAAAVDDDAIGAATEPGIPRADERSAPVVIVEQTPLPGRSTRTLAPTPGGSPHPAPPLLSRTATERPGRVSPFPNDTTLKTPAPRFDSLDSSPEIEIQLEMDDRGEAVLVPRRGTRDTETQMPVIEPVLPAPSEPRSGAVLDEARRSAAVSDGIPGAIRSQSAVIPPVDPRRAGDRPSTINAATLPPARPISRPSSRPAIAPPQVVTRPVASEEHHRSRRESEAIEVYSPAPGSVELPGPTTGGQYAQYPKKTSTRIPIEGLKEAARDAMKDAPKPTPSAPVPAGLGRPTRAGSPSTLPPRSAMVVPSGAAPVVARPVPQTEPIRARAPTPSRLAGAATPGTAGPVPSRVASSGGGGVVMTRPAVIVGAPARSAPGTMPRIRKAREDEGRGFGQGLISEKSLDEVILAYLSEDADDK